MTVCEKIYSEIEKCGDALSAARNRKDGSMVVFFSNAIRGLEKKMSSMTIEQLSKVI